MTKEAKAELKDWVRFFAAGAVCGLVAGIATDLFGFPEISHWQSLMHFFTGMMFWPVLQFLRRRYP